MANGESTVRARLIQAADEELSTNGSLTGRFDAVARRAGVSRATAYRQLGSVSELMVQVGLRRSQKHIAHVNEMMRGEKDALAKIEVAMIYSARELPNEPIVLDLIARQPATVVDPEVRRLVTGVLAPALVDGQAAGEIRADVDLESMIEYLTEQCYLVTQSSDRSADAVRQRFRRFVAPAICGTAGGTSDPSGQR